MKTERITCELDTVDSILFWVNNDRTIKEDLECLKATFTFSPMSIQSYFEESFPLGTPDCIGGGSRTPYSNVDWNIVYNRLLA